MLLCLTSIVISASEIRWTDPDTGIIYMINQEDGYAIVNSSPTNITGEVVLLSSITYGTSSYQVKKISYNAFDRRTGLTGIAIPTSVTDIGSEAFSGCKNLTKLVIPSSVTTIDKYAFSGCKGLTNLIIPSSVKTIKEGAFRYCNGLTSIIVEDDNPNYDSRNNCNAIISKSGNVLIQGCNNTVIPPDIEYIGSYAFDACEHLTEFNASSVKGVGEYAFSLCKGLTNISMPNATSIGNGAFRGCSNLKSASIPLVTSIGGSAFSDCTNLIDIDIPSSTKTIGYSAFNGCSSITSFTIPASVTTIGEDAFLGCSGVTSFIVSDDNPYYDSRNNCNAVIRTPDNTLLFGCMNTIIPTSVTSINCDAFKGCTSLTSITIPNSIKEILYSTFLCCI